MAARDAILSCWSLFRPWKRAHVDGPCERVFSSAKVTDALRRDRLRPVLMEALIFCKYALKSERLDFHDDWVDIDPEVPHAMVSN